VPDPPDPLDPLEAIRSTILGADSTVLGDGGDRSGGGDGDGRAGEPAAAGGPRYQRLALLGSGGMGRVERALDRDLRRDVAVKLLRADLGADLTEQFLWEARVTAHLDHPNIVPIHDLVASGGGELFFTMKLVRGRTLAELIAELRDGGGESMSVPRRLRCFLTVCHAIGFAHSRGVLHRDLKPANVMVGEYGEILVTDWGLALPLPGRAGDALRAIAPATQHLRSAGTPVYMSPEQASGDALDARSDIYSLGALLYELVSLRRPVEGGSVAEVMTKVAAGEVVPLREVCPSAPPGLDAVVAQAMAHDREQRYPDADALARDIEIVLDGRAPAAEHASPLTRLGRYYLGHDPAIGTMRVVEVDMWVGAATLVGIGLGAWTAGWIGSWWWVPLIVGLIAWIPPTVHFLRERRRVG